jgi:hypothetical protein
VAVAFLAALLVAVAFLAAVLVATVFFAVALVAVVPLAAAFGAVGFAAVAFFAAAAGLAEAFLAGALPATVVDFATFAVVDLGLAVVARTVAFAAAESAGAPRLADGFGVRVVVVFAAVLRAPDLAVAFGADAVLADDLAAPDFVPAGRDDEADLLAAGRTEARLAAGLVAEADFASADFEAVGFAAVVPALLEAVAVTGFFAAAVVAAFFAAGLPAAAPVARFCDAAGLSAVVVLVPARLAAGLVGAFVAAAIGMFLLANDCGLVSAWRLMTFRLGHRKSAPA